MPQSTPKDNVAKTAHLTAWIRTLGRLTDAASDDHLAQHFLLPHQRWTVRAPRVSRFILERVIPGAFGYFNARTCHFDAVLRQEAAAGLDQLVLLGAGFDSRPFRFAQQLVGTTVFEVDLPQVLKLRTERLRTAGVASSTLQVPIDFEHEDLANVLTTRGFVTSGMRTLFLWEGVTYYLPQASVDAVLASVAALSSPRSSILFDYVTRAFFQGDESSYGAKSLAQGWRQLGNVNRSGVSDVAALVQPHGFRLRSDIDAQELERRHLRSLPGSQLRVWGPMRIAHAEL